MLSHGLPRHGKAIAQFVQGLSVPGVKPISSDRLEASASALKTSSMAVIIGNQMVACQEAQRKTPPPPSCIIAWVFELLTSLFMSLQIYLAFVAACVALALLPGPMVTLVIANGLRHGTRAALTNVAGAQLGLGIVIAIVAVGLTSLMATMGH